MKYYIKFFTILIILSSSFSTKAATECGSTSYIGGYPSNWDISILNSSSTLPNTSIPPRPLSDWFIVDKFVIDLSQCEMPHGYKLRVTNVAQSNPLFVEMYENHIIHTHNLTDVNTNNTVGSYDTIGSLNQLTVQNTGKSFDLSDSLIKEVIAEDSTPFKKGEGPQITLSRSIRPMLMRTLPAGSYTTSGDIGDQPSFTYSVYSYNDEFYADSFFTDDSILSGRYRLEVADNTCEWINDGQTVTLPTISTNSFSGVGSMAGSTTFSIGLVCQPNTFVIASLAEPGSVIYPGSDIMSLDSSSTAEGVGLRLFLEGESTPIKFGSIPVLGDFLEYQWDLGTTDSSGYVVKNLIAKYVQTENTIKAGTVRAKAWVYIYYR